MDEENANIRFLSAISYIGVLFIVGRFSVEKNNPDVRFHQYQGMVLWIVFTVMYLADGLLFAALSFSAPVQAIVTFLTTLAVGVAHVYLCAVGIRSALRFQQTVLPFSIGLMAVKLRETIDRRFGS